MAHDLEARIVQQVRDIGPPAGEKIVHAENFGARFEQALAQEGTDEAGTAGHENSGSVMHPNSIFCFFSRVKRGCDARWPIEIV